MAKPNFADKTIWTGDNLDILRGMNSECVDLIYLDPPFNSNKDYAAPVGSKAAGAAFKDTWTLSDLDVAWMGLIADEQPAIANLLHTAGLTHGKGMQSYLTMMAVRLMEMRRVLKPTGSIYLHCDPTAGHYLKLLMDAVFGAGNCQSEVVWKRSGGKSDALRWGITTDRLLFYTKSQRYTWNPQYQPLDPSYVARAYRYDDGDGRGTYRRLPLHAAGVRFGESGDAWRGYDPSIHSRHWSMPTRGSMHQYIVARGLIEGWPDAYTTIQDKLDALDRCGLIVHSESYLPEIKTYLASTKGVAATDLVTDIPMASGSERTGYPTQKPLALLERVIKASSNEGDVVLDPFCGCATACVAAEKLGRKWVGIDLSPKAVELVQERLRTAPPLGIGSLFHNRLVTVRTDIPRRTDIEAPVNYRKLAHVIYGEQMGYCAGCRGHFEFRGLEVDHIVPRSRGGTDHRSNLQMLCSHCNRIKGDRDQAYLVARLKEMWV